MEIFIDTANLDDIRKYADYGIIDGVTTNPALIAKEGQNFLEVIEEICAIVDGPVSVEVVGNTSKEMINEARRISKLHKNIVVKIPASLEGFKALKVLGQEIRTNFTIVYSSNQALLAAKLNATYVSPFVGRLDVNSTNGTNLINEIVKIYQNYNFQTKILAASMRNSVYVKEAALSGAHVATIPPEVIEPMMFNELTELSLDGFLKAWNELPQNKKIF